MEYVLFHSCTERVFLASGIPSITLAQQIKTKQLTHTQSRRKEIKTQNEF
jgi:hypothetical protein